MKKSITRTEYHALVGIKSVADMYKNVIDSLEEHAARVLEEEKTYYGYDCASELIWNDSVDDFLNRMKIIVEEESA